MYEPKDPKPGVKRLRCEFPTNETHRPEKNLGNKLKVVDFVWSAARTTWLVEIKDPEATPEDRRGGEVRGTLAKLASGDLVDEHFLPKLFGTYVWLRREGILRPVSHRYAVLVPTGDFDAALRNAVTDRIQREIDAIGPLDRATGRAPVAEAHGLASWNAIPATPEIVREA